MQLRFSSQSSPHIRFSAQKPMVGVIDDFTHKDVDIDGDGVADLSHGDVVSRVLQSFCPNVEIVPFQVRFTEEQTPQENHAKALKQFSEVHRRILREKLPLAAINYSNGSDMKFAEVIMPAGETLTPDSLASFRGRMLAWARESSRTQHRLARSLVSLIKRNIPVFQTAGNDYGRSFNFLSLVQGTYTIAAANAKGTKARYSNLDSLTTHLMQGTFNVTKVPGGFDITGKGHCDVKDSEVSGGVPLASKFTGKPLTEVLITKEEEQAMRAVLRAGAPLKAVPYLFDKLFRIQDLAPHLQSAATLVDTPDEYAMFYGKGALQTGFSADDKGIVIYDPAESGQSGAINHIWGTSFACPAAIGELLESEELPLRTRS